MRVHSASDGPGMLAFEQVGRSGGELDHLDAALHRSHRVEEDFPVLIGHDARELGSDAAP